MLIDLKTKKITHQDVGQMDMYVRMYDELKKTKEDNPTIGILLCSETDADIAKYSILKGNEQLFASKYKLYLPTEEELKDEIERYLSSYKLGDKTEELKRWIAEHNNKICLIPNSRDVFPDGERKTKGIQEDVKDLENIGFDVTVISLKDYFNRKEELSKRLEEFNAFYAIGGNTFALRQAMYLSGFDKYLKSIENKPDYLYAGYSAGICVLAKDMHGLDICDDPSINPYGIETIWEGLGYFDYIFLPHYKSNHKETKLIDDSVEYCNKNHIKYKTLRDGDVIIVDTCKSIEQEEER